MMKVNNFDRSITLNYYFGKKGVLQFNNFHKVLQLQLDNKEPNKHLAIVS